MRGFRYVDDSLTLPNCPKLEDEICNGGPEVWTGLNSKFSQCLKPCRVSIYTDSRIESRVMTYSTDTENQATFLFVTSKIRDLEKELLVYDTNDVIGTIGGTLGIAVGLSVFGVFSCFIDKFLDLLNVFQKQISVDPFSTQNHVKPRPENPSFGPGMGRIRQIFVSQ